MPVENVTAHIERSLERETQCGVKLTNLYAIARQEEFEGMVPTVEVNGEIEALDGQPTVDVRLTILVNDEYGRLAVSEDHYFLRDDFLDFEHFSTELFLGPDQKMSRLRVIVRPA